MSANRKPPLVFLHIVLLSILSSQIIASPEAQAEALVKWKNSLTPPPPLTSWSLSNLNNLCNWTSIVCDSTGTVSEINLSSGAEFNGTQAKLIGTLAHFNFTPFLNLTRFDLSHNHLCGPITSEIGRLTELCLTVLDLSQNKFNGTVPESLFTNLGKLELLYLFDNLFRGPLSPNISHLSKLKYLRLGVNQFSGLIPEDIGAILNLRIIGMFNNSLEGRILCSLGQLKGLSILRLGMNSLNFTIPSELGFCANLTELGLATNSFTGEIPPEISLFTKLKYLYLYSNQLSGSIPYEIGNLKDLIELDLSKNHLWFDSSDSLEPQKPLTLRTKTSSLSSNELSGEIPTVLGNLRLLYSLNLSRNHLTGEIPWNLVSYTSSTVPENCESLLTKDLTNNYMNMVDLSSNRLLGNILEDLARLSQSESLNLSHNQLSGEFSSSFSGMVSLSNISIDFSYNNLTSLIPTSFVFKDAPATAYVGNSAIVARLKTCYRKTKLLKQESRSILECEEKAKSLIWGRDRKFTSRNIVKATENFHENYSIGKGGF
ncbi:MDIS1-interacting receptor like kinase 2-like [Corylus avellana]|uniref:MDIS1-interacting receptor like kinase 2-like n=1 Tax=Corylus avellana TaxID=13451 RepID=UPI00286AF52F|nr:MDIS1-interacting receptor like kinase 2-like [Corylus avellana]